MADRSALGKIGLMLGAATAMVMMIGGVVVNSHLSGHLHLDDNVRVSVVLPNTAR